MREMLKFGWLMIIALVIIGFSTNIFAQESKSSSPIHTQPVIKPLVFVETNGFLASEIRDILNALKCNNIDITLKRSQATHLLKVNINKIYLGSQSAHYYIPRVLVKTRDTFLNSFLSSSVSTNSQSYSIILTSNLVDNISSRSVWEYSDQTDIDDKNIYVNASYLLRLNNNNLGTRSKKFNLFLKSFILNVIQSDPNKPNRE